MDKTSRGPLAQAVFTPGSYHRDGTFVYALGVDRNGRVANRMSLQVQHGWVNGEWTTEEERLATAALLQTAPDLYEALRLLLHEVNASGNANASDFGWPLAVRASVDALAKAEGRSAPTAPSETP